MYKIITATVALMALGSVAAAASPLNGVYGSHGSGTLNGQPVTEVDVWTFHKGVLVKLTEVISDSAGTAIFGCGLSPEQNAPLPYMLLTPSGSRVVPRDASDNRIHMLGFGCPVEGSANHVIEAYVLTPESGGRAFDYLLSDDEGTPQAALSIAGHGVHR